MEEEKVELSQIDSDKKEMIASLTERINLESPENRKKISEQLLSQIEEEEAEVLDVRTQRVKVEEQILSLSPEQRKLDVLDYVRRGKQGDNISLMPEVLKAVPDLLDSGVINFDADSFNLEETKKRLVEVAQEIESEIRQNDKIVRDVLKSKGLDVAPGAYLDERWYRNYFLKVIESFVAQPTADAVREKNPKFTRTADEYENSLIAKYVKNLEEKGLSGNLAELLVSLDRNGEVKGKMGELGLNLPPAEKNPLKDFIIAKMAEDADKSNRMLQFKPVPKLEKYEGEKVETPPDLKNQRIRKNIKMVPRDSLPDFKGVIIDGNFGYDSEGNIINPTDRLIVDHHDQLDDKRYDTATIMASRFWLNGPRKDQVRLWKKRRSEDMRKYESDDGHLLTMVNHLDSDSILSLWEFRNPHKTQEYRSILNDISKAGDFLLGSNVLEYGATSRDYNYIIQNYLSACSEQIKEQKKQEVVSSELALEKEMEAIQNDLKAIEEKILLDPSVQALSAEIADIKNDPQLQGKERGIKVKEKERELAHLKDGVDPEASKRLVELKNELVGKQGESKKFADQKRDIEKSGISIEDNLKILNHMLDVIEDMITNPFKYQKFLLQGREEEEETISAIEKDYKEGAIEIEPDDKDSGLLIIRPLKGGGIKRYESIDGIYFFLRKRLDFRDKLVVNLEKDSYSVAINTQNMADLKKYDMNPLAEILRTKESEIINQLIEKTEAELTQEKDEKKRAKISDNLKRLKANSERNTRGALWRNRTQFIFSFKTYMSQEDFLETVRKWKEDHDNMQNQK